jgi:hypothetical protein
MRGAFNPAPFVFGGAAASDLEALQTGLAELMGSALAKERGSLQWIENHATARVFGYLYGLVRRFGNQSDPTRMVDGALERWEAILGISVGSHDTGPLRRERVAAKLSLIGGDTTFQAVNDYLTRILGAMYQGLIFTDPMNATTYVPGGGSVPGGPTFIDGALAGPSISPFASSVAYVAIKLEKPADMTEAEFYERASTIYDEVDGLVGAWMDFDWFRDGPSGAGFYLDQNNNLDNQRFDA